MVNLRLERLSDFLLPLSIVTLKPARAIKPNRLATITLHLEQEQHQSVRLC